MQDPKTQLFSDENSSSNDKHSTTSIAEDSALYKKWGIDTSFLSVVQEDQSAGLRITRQALEKDLGIHAASIEDAEAVKTIVAAVGRRAARLSAVAIGAIIISSGKLKGNSSISITRQAVGGEVVREGVEKDGDAGGSEVVEPIPLGRLADLRPLGSERWFDSARRSSGAA